MAFNKILNQEKFLIDFKIGEQVGNLIMVSQTIEQLGFHFKKPPRHLQGFGIRKTGFKLLNDTGLVELFDVLGDKGLPKASRRQGFDDAIAAIE